MSTAGPRDAGAEVALRPATPEDFAAILALNDAWVRFTSPLDEAALADLHRQAAYHRVAEVGRGVSHDGAGAAAAEGRSAGRDGDVAAAGEPIEGRIAGFLLAIGPGQPYTSPNYRWFAARAHDFLYIDRVVVAGDRQGAGVGRALYDDVIAWAVRRGFGRLVCEVDVEPPNPVSDAFHRRFGFVEVGTQWVAGGTKRVSLRELVVAGRAGPRR